MTGRTHLSAGILTGEIIILTSGTDALTGALAATVAAAVGSLLPDIDHPQSTMSTSNKATKAISSSVSAVTQHRGFTHTLVFTVCVTLLMRYLLSGRLLYADEVTIGLCAGMLSHLFLDTLNAKGVMWLWPLWGKPLHIASIKTGSKSEDVFRVLLNIAATVGLAIVLYKTVLLPYFKPVLETVIRKFGV